MPEYLAPGVYVEERSFRSKSIEGVSTSTTAFVGPTRRGPIGDTPELLTSIADFTRIYGGSARLELGDTALPNYLALAVQAYFDNGGGRLYVARTFEPEGTDAGVAGVTLDGADETIIRVEARFPGQAGNGRVSFSERRAAVSGSAIGRLPAGTVVEIPGTGTGSPTYAVRTATGWADAAGASATAPTTGLALSVSVAMEDADGNLITLEDLSYASGHARFIGDALSREPKSRTDDLQRPFAVIVGEDVAFTDLRDALLAAPSHALTGGSDGAEPDADTYRDALLQLEALGDVSIVAAPGHTELAAADAIRTQLITHVEGRGLYRVAVLDSALEDAVSDIRATRGGIDSDRAALYYPWVRIANPEASPGNASEPAELLAPPSGFVAGIYARNDVERGVWKAPANEVVRGALRFERDITFGENEVLNPLGINCLRFFPGRGYRVWGARTASSDPEWKYLNVRRYFNYLEASIERGTQWAVFEPNGPALWANVRETISSFLYNEWSSGALLGDTPKEAYFVRCDRTTMTQNDLDNGRMICLIGVAALTPAEFVIFRIGQKTATARD